MTIPRELGIARQVLDTLKETVDAEEATGFDPSGSSGRDRNGLAHNGVDSESGNSGLGWSSLTDDTSLSHGMSALDLDGSEFDAHGSLEDNRHSPDSNLNENHGSHLEGLDDASKEAQLIETFPGLKPFDIKWTLKKCKGSAELAIEELLNQSFLEDSGHRRRGIDAFSESDIPARTRKDRRKKKRTKATPEIGDTEDDMLLSTPMENRWQSAPRDIDFISSRTQMLPQQVSSIYHENGASLPAAINAIIEAHLSLNLKPEHPSIAIHASDLQKEFPMIPASHLLTLTQLTHPSTTSAHELAVALLPKYHPHHNGGPPIQIEFRLPPPDLSSPLPKLKPKSHNAVYTSSTPAPPFPNFASEAEEVASYLALRTEAKTKASAAYRRGKSDHLMAGAAAYYSSLGREYDNRLQSASSAAADALVASQSSTTQLDLHGVGVRDAVRIARERVTAWWAGMRGAGGGGSAHGREERGRTHAGFRIVTGKGTHSEGGKGKLGPAVGRMLIREGWKVEVGSGVLVVTGVVKGK